MREDGKYQESDEAYDTFFLNTPNIRFWSTGYMGLAANAELEKHPDKAIEMYKVVGTQSNSSYMAPMSLFHQARLIEAKGQIKEAQQLFESLVKRYRKECLRRGGSGSWRNRRTNITPESPKPGPAAKCGTSAATFFPPTAKSPEP